MSAEDKRKFKDIFWQRVCQKYRHLSSNRNEQEFIFDYEDIGRDVNTERGLGIRAFYEPFIGDTLLEIQDHDGLIEITQDRTQFRLTQHGIEHCKRSPVTYG